MAVSKVVGPKGRERCIASASVDDFPERVVGEWFAGHCREDAVAGQRVERRTLLDPGAQIIDEPLGDGDGSNSAIRLRAFDGQLAADLHLDFVDGDRVLLPVDVAWSETIAGSSASR